MTKPTDRKLPLFAEGALYQSGEQDLAIGLYAKRLEVSRTSAEDAIREYLTNLGFGTLPAVFIPRSN